MPSVFRTATLTTMALSSASEIAGQATQSPPTPFLTP
jgi:hypothetical protein